MAAPDWISPWADRGSRGGARVFFNQYGLTRTGMGGCKGPRNGRRQTRYYPPARPAFLSLHYRFPTRYQVIPFIFLPRVYIRYSSGLEFVLSSQSLTKTTTGLVARTETLIYRPGPGKLSHSGIWQKGGGRLTASLGAHEDWPRQPIVKNEERGSQRGGHYQNSNPIRGSPLATSNPTAPRCCLPHSSLSPALRWSHRTQSSHIPAGEETISSQMRHSRMACNGCILVSNPKQRPGSPRRGILTDTPPQAAAWARPRTGHTGLP